MCIPVGDDRVGLLNGDLSVVLLKILEADLQVKLTSSGNDVLARLLNADDNHGIRLGEALETLNQLSKSVARQSSGLFPATISLGASEKSEPVLSPHARGDGETVAYALWNLEDRGIMFVGSGEKTYQGMIIGENAKPDDLDVNPLKGKQLTNVRASGKDEAVRLTPPRRMTLEQAIAYISDDELVEVTPKSIRLRKAVLNPSFRKKRMREDA